MQRITTILIAFTLFAACANDGNDDENGAVQKDGTPSTSVKTLPSSTGAKAEIIIVCDDTIWDGKAGTVIKRVLAKEQYASRNEPYFDLFQLRKRDFKEMLTRTRHLIHIEKGKSNRAVVETDVYARPQNFVHIVYNDGEILDSLVKSIIGKAFTSFRELDMEITRKKWKGRTWPSPKNMAKEGITFMFPKSFQTTVDERDLVVGWAESKNADLVMFVHTRPFSFDDQLTFQREDIIRWRDSISKRHIPASREGSYTETETDPGPEIKVTKVGDYIGFETRGYFRSVGDFMGGSFINITLFDDANERVIMMDGLVYAPNQKKRNILMELEAIFRSVDIK